jgi:hypothetical protein
MNYTAQEILICDQIKNEMGRAYGMCTGIWYGNLKEGDNLENVAVNGRLILKWILKKQDIKQHKK